jgi:hypothetical protein
MNLNDLPFHIYGDATFRGKCPTESLEQITFFSRLRREGALAIHPRNEGQLRGGQITTIQKVSAEGMVKGASDIIIPGRVSFVCELKRADHTKGAWQDGQIEYLTAAHNAGAFACVALGCNGAWAALQDWLSFIGDTP